MTTKENFDDALLQDYMDNFYGYGSYSNPYWFVGMEEAGLNTVSFVNSKLYHWQSQGRKEVQDLKKTLDAQGAKDYIRWPKPTINPTWRGLIKILLTIKGQNPDQIHQETIGRYQVEELGRDGGSDCIIELLPLPSSSTQKWVYNDHSELESVKSRRRYTEIYAPKRAAVIKANIQKHTPKVVVFYGSKYLSNWTEIAGGHFTRAKGQKYQTYHDSHTLYIAMNHPVARGTTNEAFYSIGRYIAEHLA